MKNLASLLVLFYYFYIQISFEVTCLDDDISKCSRNETLESTTTITCSPNIVITLTDSSEDSESSVSIMCNKSQTDLSVLIDLNITTDHYSEVEIEGCSLPISSVEHNAASLPMQLQKLFQNTFRIKITLTNGTTTNSLLQAGRFSDLYSLHDLDLSANNLTFVPEDTFSKSMNIEELVLSNNLINTFEKHTFSGLEKLRKLDVSKNKISHLPEGLFSRNKQLSVINISHNLLKNIETNYFLGPRFLQILDLSHNKIKSISGEQFSQLEFVWHIDLSHNQLVSLALDPLLSDLYYSVFYNCTNLGKLDLQNNSLTEIYEDWRPQQTELHRLNLTYNKMDRPIQTLGITIGMITQRHRELHEIKMELGSVQMHLFKGRFQSTVIDISNNSLNCNCDLLTSLYNVSRYFNKIRTELDGAVCTMPKRLEGVRMIELNWIVEYGTCQQLPSDDIQKFHQGCPEGCRCAYRPFTKSSVINCQNADLQDYPRTLPVAPDADHTELTLYGNKLKEFSLPDDPGFKNVTFLNLAENSLSTLEINGVSNKLKKLDLSHNKLKTLSVETLDLLESALELERLELHNNSWTYDVSNYRLARLVHNKQHLIWFNVTCEDGSPIEKLIELYLVELNRRQVTTYVVSGVVVMLLMIVFILTVLYYTHRQKVHVYCFSSRWKVLRWLVSHLDHDNDNKPYVAYRNTSPGDGDASPIACTT